jgi:hypothetical protein
VLINIYFYNKERGSLDRKPGQDRHNRTGRDMQNTRDRTWQAKRDSQNRTGRKVRAEWD